MTMTPESSSSSSSSNTSLPSPSSSSTTMMVSSSPSINIVPNNNNSNLDISTISLNLNNQGACINTATTLPSTTSTSTTMANSNQRLASKNQQLRSHLSSIGNGGGNSYGTPPPQSQSILRSNHDFQCCPEKDPNNHLAYSLSNNNNNNIAFNELLSQTFQSSFWNFRSRFERLLLLIVFIVSILCIVLLVLMIILLINQPYFQRGNRNADNNNNNLNNRFDINSINNNNNDEMLIRLIQQLPSYPNPQMIPGYHYYYATNNNGHNQNIPSSSLHNSTTSNEIQLGNNQQFPTKFYQNFIPTPMGPIFSALQHVRNQHYHNQQNQHNHYQSSLLTNQSMIIQDFQDPKSVCLRPGCVKAASEILNLIDETVNPCDDFYRFACGGWIHRTTIPDEAGHISIFEQSRERLDIQLKDLIETTTTTNTTTNETATTPAIETMKNMYRSCMNLTAIEKLGITSLRNALDELGGWPVVQGSSWNESTFDWINVTRKIRKIGFKPEMFVTFKVIADVMNNTRNMIFVDEATLGLRRQLITQGSNHTTVRVYHQLMVDTALLFGATNRTQIEIEMWDTIALESQIAHATHDPMQGEKKQSWYLYLKAFADVANQSEVLATNQTRLGHDWIRFINAAIDLPDGSQPFTEKELVMVDNIRYMGQIDYLISFVNKHDKRLLANYMLWRVVLQNLGTGSKMMRDMRDNLNKHLYGITEKMARWKLCLSQLTGSLAMALSSHYIKHNFNETSREKAKEMVQFIQQEFEDILHHTDWMDNETKKNAFKKSKSMKAIVGYPAELSNDTLIEQHYKDLQLTPDNFDLNIRRVRIWAHRNEFKKLRQRNDPHNWKYFSNAANVNAFYWSQANSIVIPAGILRDIFFDHDRPQYLNFGTIGYVIGHEITHGFDNIGAQFDEIGNARNWWKNETKKHYNEKAQCMVKQYREYPLLSSSSKLLQINGDLTLKENIADNGAIKEAYQAYEKYVSKFGEELLLPGLRYTSRQLFWIAAAMNWCSKSSPEMFKTRLDTDSHSPSEARVNVAFSNYQPFADTFGCRIGTKSNADHKCLVW
ncbi:neprilysin-2-like [Dermatophagoides pteronyssinus]|uniref:neprilysin-2-like n=1 Tax=Dermatophagoides pteronyssinus TaxID=6956 RepID=UPI003F6687EA